MWQTFLLFRHRNFDISTLTTGGVGKDLVGQDVRDLLTILKLMKWCVYYIFASVPKKKNMEKMKENKERKKESRVNARHEQADPEKHFPGAGLEGRGNPDQR